MIRRVLGAGLLVFVVLPGVWLTVEHVRGRVQLGAAIRRVEARGESLDAMRLLPAAVPASSNGMERLVMVGPRLGKLTEVLPMAMEMVAPGRAVPGTRLDWWPSTKGTNRWETLREQLEEHAEEFELLHGALTKPYRRADLDLSQGFAKMRIPHLSPMKTVGTVLAGSAVNAARNGDMEGAIEDLEALRVIERDLGEEPLLISQLVRMALVAVANSRYWAVLEARDWKEEELARLQKVRFGEGLVESTVRSLEVERAGGVYEFRYGSSQQLADQLTGDAMDMAFGVGPAPLTVPGTMEEVADFAGTFVERLGKGLLAKVLIPAWRYGWGNQAAAHYLECMEAMLEANRRGIREGSYGPVRDFDLVGRLETSGYGRLRTLFSRLSLVTFERAPIKAYRGEMESRLNETGVALRRYRLRHGRWPEGLAQLVPEFLGAVPTDPMDGQPLRYRKDEGEGYALWSVGMDSVDDGGDGGWESVEGATRVRQWWQGKDAVWPQPVSGAEIAAWLEQEGEKIAARNRKQNAAGGGGGRFNMSAELMRRYGLIPNDGAAATNAGTGGKRAP